MIPYLDSARRIAWLIAALLVLASLVGNALLLQAWLQSSARCELRVERLVSGVRIAEQARALSVAESVASDAAATATLTAEQLDRIAMEQLIMLDRYWTRLKDIPPLPEGCGPGQQRVDAFNNKGD